jgi:hypothetical protein
MEIELKEIWKPIIDFEDYQISNLGNIHNVTSNKRLKPYIDSPGYMNISLCKNKKRFKCKIHRLIAIAFIPNPENKPTIHHKDKNKLNNSIENLEWATMSEQNMKINKQVKSIHFMNASSKSMHQIDIVTNNIIQTFDSIKNAAKWIFENKLSKYQEFNRLTCSIISSKICSVAKNSNKEAFGFYWKYNLSIQVLEGEIWKEVPLYLTKNQNGYFVSSYGRYKNNSGQIIENHLYSSGYKRVNINNTSYLLHRLVAITFLENPQNKEQVNHIDGNKINNKVNNLEWATNQENQIHKIKTGLYTGAKKIIQYDLEMNEIQSYDSIVDTAKKLNISVGCISDNCRGKTTNTKCGFFFRYKDKIK